jgi:hypothetical protein
MTTDENLGRRAYDGGAFDGLARDIQTLMGSVASLREKVEDNLDALVRQGDETNRTLHSLDGRVAIQNGRVGKLEERVLDVEQWQDGAEKREAWRDGAMALPKLAVQVVVKRPVLSGLATLLLGALAGANLGALAALVASMIGL